MKTVLLLEIEKIHTIEHGGGIFGTNNYDPEVSHAYISENYALNWKYSNSPSKNLKTALTSPQQNL